jgi:toxin-antitoxin system PIN domain toxin
MIFPDVNILLYAYDTGSKFHRPAVAWLESVLAKDQVFFSWQTLTGFLRIVTSRTILSSPMPLETAVQIVNEWLELENTHLVSLDKKTWPLFAKTLIESQASGNLVMDAHIAAAAASCGATIATTDRDFSRFSDVRITDPLKT